MTKAFRIRAEYCIFNYMTNSPKDIEEGYITYYEVKTLTQKFIKFKQLDQWYLMSVAPLW